MSRTIHFLRTLALPFVLLFAALSLNAAPASSDVESGAAVAGKDAAVATRVDKATADSLYAAKQYPEASDLYRLLADSIESTDVYYNLGCAEYKQKHYGRAVLAFERALRIDPDNDDAQYNITLVRTQVEDRFAEPSEMFFISWFRTWVASGSVGHWTLLSFVWLVAFFGCTILYFVGRRLLLRKAGFFTAIFCALAFVLTTVFAIVQRSAYANNSDAVIMADEVQLYSSPSTSSKLLRTIHEGTTVTVLDVQKGGWMLVELPDATEGYLNHSQIEFVVPAKRTK